MHQHDEKGEDGRGESMKASEAFTESDNVKNGRQTVNFMTNWELSPNTSVSSAYNRGDCEQTTGSNQLSVPRDTAVDDVHTGKYCDQGFVDDNGNWTIDSFYESLNSISNEREEEVRQGDGAKNEDSKKKRVFHQLENFRDPDVEELLGRRRPRHQGRFLDETDWLQEIDNYDNGTYNTSQYQRHDSQGRRDGKDAAKSMIDLPDDLSDVGDDAEEWAAFMADNTRGVGKKKWGRLRLDQLLDVNMMSRSLAPRRRTPWI